MKLSEYLMFAALLSPTVTVVVAACISIASAHPAPEYRPPFQVVSSAGLYPADMSTDE